MVRADELGPTRYELFSSRPGPEAFRSARTPALTHRRFIVQPLDALDQRVVERATSLTRRASRLGGRSSGIPAAAAPPRVVVRRGCGCDVVPVVRVLSRG